MTTLDFAITMTNIRDEYVEQAEEWKTPKFGRSMIYVKVASIFLMVGLLGALLFRGKNQDGLMGPLSVSAEELGMEEYTFGVALPKVIYGDDNIVTMYDFRGIFVYDLSEEKLVGYADFRPINMTMIQGDDPTFVEASVDGKYVKCYNSTQRYLYNVSLNELESVDDYTEIDDVFIPCSIDTVSYDDPHSLSMDYETYQVNDGSFVAVILDYDFAAGAEMIRYKNMHLIRESEDGKQEYIIFQ